MVGRAAPATRAPRPQGRNRPQGPSPAGRRRPGRRQFRYRTQVRRGERAARKRTGRRRAARPPVLCRRCTWGEGGHLEMVEGAPGCARATFPPIAFLATAHPRVQPSRSLPSGKCTRGRRVARSSHTSSAWSARRPSASGRPTRPPVVIYYRTILLPGVSFTIILTCYCTTSSARRPSASGRPALPRESRSARPAGGGRNRTVRGCPGVAGLGRP